LVEIVHGHGHAGAWRIKNLMLDDLTVLADELDGELALAGKPKVGRAILIAKGVTADDDRLGPARNEPRHVFADDRLTEDHAAQNVADRAIGRAIHALEPEFLHARLVRRDGGALHPDAVLLDGVCRV